MSISKTSRRLFSITKLFFEKYAFVCIYSFSHHLDHDLDGAETEWIRARIPMLLVNFDRHGSYLQGVEVRFGIGALKLENGVCIYSSLINGGKKPLSLTQKSK